MPEKSCPVERVTAHSFTVRSGESAGLKFFEMVSFPQLNSTLFHISDKPRKERSLRGGNLRQNCTRLYGKLALSPGQLCVCPIEKEARVCNRTWTVVFSDKFGRFKLVVVFVAYKIFTSFKNLKKTTHRFEIDLRLSKEICTLDKFQYVFFCLF